MSRGFHARWWRGSNAERVGLDTSDITTPFWWFETDTEDVFWWDGSTWRSITTGGGSLVLVWIGW